MNREEIGRNIKALLKGYADSSNEVEITVRNADEADVYLDGALFNTYLIKEKRFLNNIPKPIPKQDEFQISVMISRGDLAEKYSQYRGAELQLPATGNEIKDAMQRARITSESQAFTISECILYGENILEACKDLPLDLNKLNYLAKVLAGFRSYEHTLMRGCIAELKNSELTLDSLINASYNLSDCSIIDELSDDEQLGKIYTDNGWLPWLAGIDEKVWQYIDYQALGKDIRLSDGGIYTKDGYFVNTKRNYSEVYDGITYPEEFEDDAYMFRMFIGRKPQDCAEDENSEKWLALPVSKEGEEKFLRGLGAESFDDCILIAVQSMEQNIPMCVKDLSQLGILNSLANKMRDMEKSGELAKYKALLDCKGCKTLDEAVSLANSLDRYELYAEPSTISEYAKYIFSKEYKDVIPDGLIAHFNFAAYAEELYAKGDLSLTEYGVLKELKTEYAQITMDDQPC